MSAETISPVPSRIVEFPPKILLLSPGRDYHLPALMALKGCSRNVEWIDDPHELPLPQNPANIGEDLDFVRWRGESAVRLEEGILPEWPHIIAGTGLLGPHEMGGFRPHRRYDGKGLARLLGVEYLHLGPTFVDMIHAERNGEEIPRFCDLKTVTKRTNRAIQRMIRHIFDDPKPSRGHNGTSTPH